MSPRPLIVIPARYASTRFPGKPLARQTGKFLIQHVVEQARKVPGEPPLVVATDDPRIADAVRGFGANAVMTSPDHPSGTDRIAEVVGLAEFAHADPIINIQGDEPEIDPAVIDALIHALRRPGAQMATVSAPMDHPADADNPNIVKVVTDRNGLALYFSRAPIPFHRDGHADRLPFRKHLGIYAYRRDALLALARAPVCDLERAEKLEQLRALYLGMRIFVHAAACAPHGVDTPDDYAAFVHRYNEASARIAV